MLVLLFLCLCSCLYYCLFVIATSYLLSPSLPFPVSLWKTTSRGVRRLPLQSAPGHGAEAPLVVVPEVDPERRRAINIGNESPDREVRRRWSRKVLGKSAQGLDQNLRPGKRARKKRSDLISQFLHNLSCNWRFCGLVGSVWGESELELEGAPRHWFLSHHRRNVCVQSR